MISSNVFRSSSRLGHTRIFSFWKQVLELWRLDSGRWTLNARLWTLDSGR